MEDPESHVDDSPAAHWHNLKVEVQAWWKQLWCKHEHRHESDSINYLGKCHAIVEGERIETCSDCGKTLGTRRLAMMAGGQAR